MSINLVTPPTGIVYADLARVGVLDRIRFRNRKPGVTIKRTADGLRYMELITSNSYKDRDNETITTKALQQYVERSWIADDVCRTQNVLKFWHKGRAIGDIVWCDMEGPFLIEVAREKQGVFKHRGLIHKISDVWDYIEAHPQEKWGTSHGFLYKSIRYNPKTREVIYDHIRKFETSVLPLRYAANPFTYSGVIS